MQMRKLGNTGPQVSAIGLGGFHIAQRGLTENQSIALVRTAIDRGMGNVAHIGQRVLAEPPMAGRDGDIRVCP